MKSVSNRERAFVHGTDLRTFTKLVAVGDNLLTGEKLETALISD